MKELAQAIRLETLFAAWCGSDYYEPFRDNRGGFPGIGNAREVFIKSRAYLDFDLRHI